ncbi:alpha/beta fold hydrolase [Herbiconiux sp. P18]|uniref:alpha/beta fold hydrolase n=1 Tax=Herbiconiux liangxiaofengii TaxID=3342795 RepID=UPI003CEFD384
MKDDLEPYAPYGLVHDPATAGLRRVVVRTRVGPVVLHVSPRRTSGPATVLLHGAAGSWTTWTPLLQAADAAGSRPADLVLVDLPGWGESPFPDRPLSNGRSAVSVEAYAGVVRDAVTALGYHSWHLLGHSMGGFIALHLAVAEPARTESVSLVSPTGPAVVEAARHPVVGLVRMPGFAGLRAVMRAFAPGGGAASVLLTALGRLGLLKPVVAPLFARPSNVPGEVLATLAREVRPESFAAAARAAAAYDLGRWSGIRCPVYSVRGARDVFVSADDDQRMTELLPGLGITEVAAAGHFAHIEAPATVLAALKAARRGYGENGLIGCAVSRRE